MSHQLEREVKMDAYTFKYNDCSLAFDMDEYEDASRYNAALKKLLTTPCPDRRISQHGYIQAYCRAIRTFFDDIFGEGAAEQLIGKNQNKRTHDAAYNAFLKFVSAQVEESDRRVNDAIKKYAPGGGEK